MISQFNSAAMRTVMTNSMSEPKETKQATAPNAKLTSENKLEQLKESINSGEYKVNLTALSQKMAQELL